MTPKLELRGLGKTFGEGARQVEALHDIDLTLADNEFVSLVGTSGCGKSTLLSIVAGLQDFDHGELLVDGAPVTGPGLDRGVVFQSYTLLPWLTARQNVEFALKAAGMKRAQCREVARRASGAGEAGQIRRCLSEPALRRHAAARRHRPRLVLSARRCC